MGLSADLLKVASDRIAKATGLGLLKLYYLIYPKFSTVSHIGLLHKLSLMEFQVRYTFPTIH